MPQYLFLMYGDPADGPAPDSPEAQAEFAAWMAYSEQLAAAGVMSGGNALHPPDTATTVRVRGGEQVVSDGPFAETKELLGGYYLIEVDDLDTAIEWAGKAPHIAHGSVEVRPVIVFDQA